MAEKKWLTISELAEMVGKSKEYVRGMVHALASPEQQRQRLPAGRGRAATEYHIACLPRDMQLVVRPDAAPLPALLPPKQQRPDELKDWQREKWTACIGVVREVQKLQADGTPRYTTRQLRRFATTFAVVFFPACLPRAELKLLAYKECMSYAASMMTAASWP